MTLTKTLYATVTTATVATITEVSPSTCLWVDCSEAIMGDCQCILTYSTLGTTGAIVRIYASPDGSTYGYSPVDQFTMPFASSSIARMWSKPFIPSAKYMTATVYNPDTTSITMCTIKLTIQKST
jgi:hypothetical protein